ncbi:helix-turn-helix transcriptional regulator [Paenibacillus sp. FSL R10-2734]|uniref:helix-turn-helix domain-containing protein n=1 Tax=Paenibacillus sp. FSL R10-2734 TaxID=2954691 RepID=UPI0030DA365C
MLAKRLSDLRTKHNLTQQNMADYLGITRQAYGNYELGKRDVDTVTLANIADKLDTTTDFLLGRTNIPIQDHKLIKEEIAEYVTMFNDSELKTFLKEYVVAPKKQQQEIHRYWKMMRDAEILRKMGGWEEECQSSEQD